MGNLASGDQSFYFFVPGLALVRGGGSGGMG